MTALSQCIVGNNTIAVRMRPRNFFGGINTESWEFYIFSCYRRVAPNRWSGREDYQVSPRDIVVTETTWFSGSRGYLIEAVSNSTITLNWVTIRENDSRLLIISQRRRTVSHEWFANDMYRERLASGLELAQNVSVGVAIVCGASLAVGFGPLASAAGLAASGGTGTSVAVEIIANALATFIHGNYDAMKDAVRDDPENGAAHFYRSNKADFADILSDSLISGASGGATALFPSPPRVSTLDDFVWKIGRAHV